MLRRVAGITDISGRAGVNGIITFSGGRGVKVHDAWRVHAYCGDEINWQSERRVCHLMRLSVREMKTAPAA